MEALLIFNPFQWKVILPVVIIYYIIVCCIYFKTDLAAFFRKIFISSTSNSSFEEGNISLPIEVLKEAFDEYGRYIEVVSNAGSTSHPSVAKARSLFKHINKEPFVRIVDLGSIDLTSG
ncbi:MAG TPA: hypothetical protein VK921_03965 [Anditalea sp.]|nr:hypothetical protein [Anditalea sp.]